MEWAAGLSWMAAHAPEALLPHGRACCPWSPRHDCAAPRSSVSSSDGLRRELVGSSLQCQPFRGDCSPSARIRKGNSRAQPHRDMTAGRGALTDTKSYNHMPVHTANPPTLLHLVPVPHGCSGVCSRCTVFERAQHTSSSSSSLSLTGRRKGNTAGHNHIVI
jgi:hypothetical protein